MMRKLPALVRVEWLERVHGRVVQAAVEVGVRASFSTGPGASSRTAPQRELDLPSSETKVRLKFRITSACDTTKVFLFRLSGENYVVIPRRVRESAERVS